MTAASGMTPWGSVCDEGAVTGGEPGEDRAGGEHRPTILPAHPAAGARPRPGNWCGTGPRSVMSSGSKRRPLANSSAGPVGRWPSSDSVISSSGHFTSRPVS